MSSFEEILILQEHITYDYFLSVVEENLNLIRYKTYPSSEERAIFEDVWITPDKANAVHFLDDEYMGCRHLWVRGPQTPEIMSKVYGLLPFYDSEDLIEALSEADDHNEAVSAMLKVGVGFLTFDSQAFRAFEVCLDHPSALLRRATIQSIAYRLWPECQTLLEKVVKHDSDEKIREFAQRILKEYQVQIA
jgi:hypothetical protein